MKRKKEEGSIKKIFLAVLAVLIIATALASNYEKNCSYSEECFNNAFRDCTKAKVIAYQNSNTLEYKIIEQEKDNCIVKIKIIDVNPLVDQNTKDTFQNKEMMCYLPIEEGFTTDKLNYCEGPLKEAIYELTIQKMYNLLAQNLGEIISQMKE